MPGRATFREPALCGVSERSQGTEEIRTAHPSSHPPDQTECRTIRPGLALRRATSDAVAQHGVGESTMRSPDLLRRGPPPQETKSPRPRTRPTQPAGWSAKDQAPTMSCGRACYSTTTRQDMGKTPVHRIAATQPPL